MSSPRKRFDSDVSLAELLRAVPRPRLEAALDATVGNAWRIVDADGTLICESKAIAGLSTTSVIVAVAVPLRVDIEVVGRLQAVEERREQAEAAAKWLEMVLASAHRYRMAADLHFETITADFEELQRQHAALQESEARYRELADELDQRVKAQVEVIERAQRQLYQTEKLASIGSLAAGMAHEINNPIGFIRSNLGTASAYVDKIGETLQAFRRADRQTADALWRRFDIDFLLEDFPVMLAESESGADRVARIVSNLKAYSNIDCTAVNPVDINDAVRASASVIGDQLPDKIKLEMVLQTLPPVMCDLGRMNQVLFALLQNAVHAVENSGGTIRIASEVAGDEIRIAVSDNGCGMRDDILNRIFDPFFTTREVGRGMGLGLTVSRDIVSAHGGRIEVLTAAGTGSVFTICLPVNAGSAISRPERSS